MTSPPAVLVDGLSRRYARRWALVDVGFAVPAGALAILTGANGSGKSTLLRVLATALRPDRGRVEVFGATDAEAIRRRSALLAHHAYHYEALSARENLELAARFVGRSAEVMGHLAEVGLADRADDAVATFSAGMRRRLALARCLLQQPELALLDEPYAQLDPAGVELVDGVVERLRARGATVLMATHALERGRERADLEIALHLGRLQRCGPPA